MTHLAPLPARLWRTDPELLAGVHTDRSGWTPAGRPRAVAFAESVQDVQDVLRAASADRLPVVVRGAGTGLAGGAAATDGSVVLDVSRLNRIVELSPVDRLAVVEPGVITASLDAAAGVHGLRYAPDPASVAISTIGGNIATNAGGLRCAKYGVTRDSVLGLDVVLGDGTLISTGRRTVKGVVGYDLTGLFVGSEGTLGVVVGATLRLRPIPSGTATVAAYFSSVTAAVDGVTEVLAAGIEPAVAELLDGATLAAIADAGVSDVPAGAAAFVLLQTDGPGASTEATRAAELLRPLATSVDATDDPSRSESLLAVRRAALPALERVGRVLIEDIAVPRSRLAEAVDCIRGISESTGVDIYTFAHAADGNLHPIVVVDRSLPDIPSAAWGAADELFRLALDLGGTITGEHGVGVLKRRWAGVELGNDNLDLQRRLRAVFDPLGVLNPGKAI